jgi:hypothetical protein
MTAWLMIFMIGAGLILALWRLLVIPWHVRWEVRGAGAAWGLEIGIGFGEFPAWRAGWAIPVPGVFRPSGRATAETSPGEDIRRAGQAFHRYERFVEHLAERVVVEAAWADGELGFDDAALTAIGVGLGYGLAGIWLGYLGTRLVGEAIWTIRPRYDAVLVDGRVGSIFRVTSGDIIHAFWQVSLETIGGRRYGRKPGLIHHRGQS